MVFSLFFTLPNTPSVSPYLEKEGRIHVIRPDRDISAKPVERDPAHLKEIYEVGRRVMKADMEKLKAYLAE